MAQVVPTRDAAKAGWRWPRLRIRVNPTIAGVTLALSAWLLQAYSGSYLDARDRLARNIQLTEVQREVWLIEYNASLIRTPRNSRVTARAAYQVVRNTHDLLALSDIARGGVLTRSGPILAEAQKNNTYARELFDARDYAQLVAELDTVSRVYEERTRDHTIGMPSETGLMHWLQHALPLVFLCGILLCWKGRRSVSSDE